MSNREYMEHVHIDDEEMPKDEQIAEEIRAIPAVFFREDFSLKDPGTFNRVCPGENLGSTSILQDKLCSQLDVVEAALAENIQSHSRDFFSALTVLHDLELEVTATCIGVVNVRRHLASVQKRCVEDALDVVRTRHCINECLQLLEKMKYVQDVLAAVPVTRSLMEEADLAGALKVAEDVRVVLREHLGGVGVLQRVDGNMAGVVHKAQKVMKQEFVRLCEHVVLGSSQGSVESMLRALVSGLQRLDALVPSLLQFRSRIMVGVRGCIDQAVCKDADEVVGFVQELDAESFSHVLESAFAALNGCVAGCIALRDVLRGEQVSPEALSTCSHVIVSVGEYGHGRLARVLSFRQEQHRKLGVRDFTLLYQQCATYIKENEALCGGVRLTSLRGTLLAQARAFVEAFHRRTTSKLELLLQHELWVQAEIPREICWTWRTLVGEDRGREEKEEEVEETLVMDGEEYKVVSVTLMLVSMTGQYHALLKDMPGLAGDMIRRLSELFKLILGAGAVQSGALKNITAKHLSLTARSVALLSGLCGKLVSVLGRELPVRHRVLLSLLTQVGQDCEKHHQEIMAKLVQIMRGRVDVHLDAFSSMSLERAPLDRVSDYMKSLTKEAMALRRAVSTVLGGNARQLLVSKVFIMICDGLREAFVVRNIKSDPHTLKVCKADVHYFVQKTVYSSSMDQELVKEIVAKVEKYLEE